jgi:hypothetical protein
LASTGQCGSSTIQYCVSQVAGSSPTLVIDIDNTTGESEFWSIGIAVGHGVAPLHYDLSYWGDVSFNVLACDARGSFDCNSPYSAAGSITEPASSPYVLAVGAADGSGDNVCESDLPVANSPGDSGTYPLEAFSSQGPTIDGRIKPDILAFDGVNSNEFAGGFCGTSSAAPHVAGAAALALAADPTMDASQLQAFLEQRASGSASGVPNNPPTNASGHGVLDLGAAPPITTPTPSTYTALSSPVRALDTRTVGSGAPLGSNQTVTIPIAQYVSSLPGNATAVAINLTGTGVKGNSLLAAYAAGATYPGTSNLNLSALDSTAAVFAVVALGSPNSRNTRRRSALSIATIGGRATC